MTLEKYTYVCMGSAKKQLPLEGGGGYFDKDFVSLYIELYAYFLKREESQSFLKKDWDQGHGETLV